jgi:K+-sensing histidine kinase KdpD
MLPWVKGANVLYLLLALGVLGVAAALLGVMGKVKPLLVVFTLVSMCLFVYGFFVSPVYRFQGPDQAKTVAWIAFASLGAFVGALMQYYPRARRT